MDFPRKDNSHLVDPSGLLSNPSIFPNGKWVVENLEGEERHGKRNGNAVGERQMWWTGWGTKDGKTKKGEWRQIGRKRARGNVGEVRREREREGKGRDIEGDKTEVGGKTGWVLPWWYFHPLPHSEKDHGVNHIKLLSLIFYLSVFSPLHWARGWINKWLENGINK